MRRWFPLLLLFALAACIPAAALIPTPTPHPVSATPQTLHVVCAESLAPAMLALASAYQRTEPAVQIVVTERADTLAFQSLKDGDADVAALTWMPQTLEDVWSAPFAQDGLAVVVHPQNGLPGLSMEQLRQLFQGQMENWELWGGLPGTPQIIVQEEASGEHAFFQEQVMRDARVTLTAVLAPSSNAVLKLVGENQFAVGYVSTAYLNAQVRPLAVAGMPPANETISMGLYPLSRNLYLTTMGAPQGVARDFTQWVLSPAGQDLIAAQHLIPAPQ